jgi:2-iminoacetate synthase ThiH
MIHLCGFNENYQDITNILENIKNLHDNVGSEREF